MANGRTNDVIRRLGRVFQDGTLVGLPDRQVLERFVEDRDAAAFEALLARHGRMVFNVCRQILRDPDDAEDAFQATFLALACKAGTLRIGESLGPWLYRVAVRIAARARGDRRRRGSRERSGGPIAEPEPGRPDGSDRDEMRRILHEELDRLPERLRAPIVLCYLEGLTHERAASQLRWPVGTVRSRLARARALLHGRIARRGLVVTAAALGGLLSSDAGASPLRLHILNSLVKTATQIASGTASLRDGCGVSACVAVLVEGALNVLRVKQIIGSMAALSMIGIVSTVVALSVFPASGQTGSDPAPGRIGADAKPVGPPPAETYVKTYYVGDLLIPPARAPQGASPGRADSIVVGTRGWVDMTPLIELIKSTVAKGTWTIEYGQTPPPGTVEQRGRIVDGRLVEITEGVVTTRTVGTITPFFLSISLIVRHTAEVHDEVASLLRNMRQFLASRENPSIVAGHARDGEAPGVASSPNDQKPAPPASTPPPDRNSRIRRLLDELQREVEKLPKGQG